MTVIACPAPSYSSYCGAKLVPPSLRRNKTCCGIMNNVTPAGKFLGTWCFADTPRQSGAGKGQANSCAAAMSGQGCSAAFSAGAAWQLHALVASGYKAQSSAFPAGLGLLGQKPPSVLERAPMSDRKLLMPKATAVWLVENTSLTFEQIAELCELHVLEVKGIADGDVAQGIKGMDPISTGQLTREGIARGEEDHGYRLRLAAAKVDIPEA